MTGPGSAPRGPVYLLRHGRTPLNAGGQLRGRIDSPLDEVGRGEAARLGGLFVAVPLVAVVSSPLARSLDTAAAVAVPHGLAVEVDEGLADRDWGPWAGWPEAEVTARFGGTDRAPGVEPLDGFVQRVVDAFDRVAGRAAAGPVAAVAHDAVNRAILTALPRVAPTGRDLPQPTGCWNLVRAGPDGWSLPVVGAVPGDGSLP